MFRPFPGKSYDNELPATNDFNNDFNDGSGEYVSLLYDNYEDNNHHDKNYMNSSTEGGPNSSGDCGGGGAASVVSCPCVPSARSRCSPSALAALARSPRRYTSSLSVGTLGLNHQYNRPSKFTRSCATGVYRLGMQTSPEINKFAIPDRLSPKVYIGYPWTQRGCSMENLGSTISSASNTAGKQLFLDEIDVTKSLPHNHAPKPTVKTPTRAWGSMQEIRKVDCMVSLTFIL